MTKDLKDKLRQLKLLAFDFDGVFTDGKVLTDQNGVESVTTSRRDTLRLPELKKLGIRLVVISKERNPVVAARCRKMKVEYFHGINDKLSLFKKFLKKAKIQPRQAAFMGDDINDAECLKYAGLAFTVADGDSRCKKVANYVTKRKGGDHAVREICDLILATRAK